MITIPQFNALFFGVPFDNNLKSAIFSIVCNGQTIEASAEQHDIESCTLGNYVATVLRYHEMFKAAYAPEPEQRPTERD